MRAEIHRLLSWHGVVWLHQLSFYFCYTVIGSCAFFDITKKLFLAKCAFACRHLNICSPSLPSVTAKWNSQRSVLKKHRKSCRKKLLQKYAVSSHIYSCLFEFTLSTVSLQFCNDNIFFKMNAKPVWLGHVLLRKLHIIGFGVSTESEMSVSLSPCGMFSVLLCVRALLPTLCQALDNELIDIITDWCFHKTEIFCGRSCGVIQWA